MIEAVVFVMSFVNVCTRSFQQKNVFKDKWLWIIPNSYVMNAMEYSVIGVASVEVVTNGYLSLLPLILAGGTGAWTGCWLGMWVHNRLHRRCFNEQHKVH